MKMFNDYSSIPRTMPPEVELDPISYEDSLYKDLADDVKSSQDKINEQLRLMIEENRKASKASFWLSVSSIVISFATLFVTTLSFFIQLRE